MPFTQELRKCWAHPQGPVPYPFLRGPSMYTANVMSCKQICIFVETYVRIQFSCLTILMYQVFYILYEQVHITMCMYLYGLCELVVIFHFIRTQYIQHFAGTRCWIVRHLSGHTTLTWHTWPTTGAVMAVLEGTCIRK